MLTQHNTPLQKPERSAKVGEIDEMSSDGSKRHIGEGGHNILIIPRAGVFSVSSQKRGKRGKQKKRGEGRHRQDGQNNK